jgi:hypothetical protein
VGVVENAALPLQVGLDALGARQDLIKGPTKFTGGYLAAGEISDFSVGALVHFLPFYPSSFILLTAGNPCIGETVTAAFAFTSSRDSGIGGTLVMNVRIGRQPIFHSPGPHAAYLQSKPTETNTPGLKAALLRESLKA